MSDLPPRHVGRVVDPSVADDEDEGVPIEQLSEEPPPIDEEAVRDEPTLRPHTFPPMPPSDLLLDPRESPPPIPERAAPRMNPSFLSPSMTAVFGALFGLAGLFAIFAILHRFSPHDGAESPPIAAETAPTVASAIAVLNGLPDFEDEGPALAGPWRITKLKDDDRIRMLSGTVGLNPFVTTLQKKGLSKKETYRILAAFKGFDALKRPRKHDGYTVAVDRATGRVKAFELTVSAIDIYQAREDDAGLLVGSKLDMMVASRQRVAAVRITGPELALDLRRGKLREKVTKVVDRAFDGRASVATMPEGSTLRLIVQEQTALGRFASYSHVEALEYASSKADAKPLRIYRFKDGSRWGYFDQRGREPFRGGWRRPLPGAPVTSPFNPKRMHPILKVVRPHNGIDFGAGTGTPVHATSYGKIDFIGPRGAAGNLVIISHPQEIDSYYMHLHAFAPGLKQGDKVETFQVIGQVGTTGRSTGPHLHFGVKKKGKWIDPNSLKMDGDRLVSKSRREQFEKVRAEFDKQLDAIPLPTAAAPVTSAAAEPAPPAPAASLQENFDDEEALEPEGMVDPNDQPDKPR